MPGGAQKAYFKASSVLYTDGNKADTGINPEPTINAAATPLYDTAELMRSGKLERINVYWKTGDGSTASRGSYRMFVKAELKQALLGKYQNPSTAGNINGKAVSSASSATGRQVKKY
jgi:hypothetical protein